MPSSSQSTIDGLAKEITMNQNEEPQKQSVYQRLMELVFDDGDMNWGRTVVFFYTVGKLAKQVNWSLRYNVK